MSTRYYGVQNEVKAYCNRLQNETSIVVTPSVLKTLNDRVESLKRSGVWSQFGLGFNDVDGDAYLSRASITDVIGRAEVLWFTRGIKSLGLWNNMVSWPLRSYQNTGTGSTVRSLGGLGTFDGTLVNGPSWGTNGAVFSSSNSAPQIMTTTLNRSMGVMSMIASATFFGRKGGGVDDWPGIIGFPVTAGFVMGGNNAGTAFGANRLYNADVFAIAIAYNNPFFQSVSFSPTEAQNWLNNSTSGGAWTAPNWGGTNLAIGGANTQYFNGQVSFAAFTPVFLNNSDKARINSLYKSTLGNGLGLP
jgi:hypothetical protein